MRLHTARRLMICLFTFAALATACTISSRSDDETALPTAPQEMEVEQEIVAIMPVISATEVYTAPPPQKEDGRYVAVSKDLTNQDVGLMAMVVYHESRGESHDGQRAVCEVILNRLMSDAFPDTIEEVIYQKNQFACANALTTSAYQEPGALAAAFDVVEEVLCEEEYAVPAHYCFFSTGMPRTDDYIQIGNHYFR